MIAEEILKERYYQEGEDWSKLCRRVANAIAKGEAGQGMEYIFYDCLFNKKFLPNSPTLMNAGTGDGTLSACFTVDVEDNMESIFDTVKDMAIIGKWGGGIGTSWSKVRPEGSRVGSTNGVSSGPVSFLETVDVMADVVKQGGKRRIAIMSVLDVDHADIKKFITVKNDLNKLLNMNMSVMITDEFMTKVYNNDKDALDIWNLIIKQAWATGEPGVLFFNRINRDNFTPQIPIKATNPCMSPDTVILTEVGCCRIDSVVNKTIKVWNGFEWSSVTPKVTGINQEMLQIECSNGASVKCTKYHTFILNDGTKTEAKDLKIGDQLINFKLPDHILLYNRATAITNNIFITSIKDAGIEDKVYCFNDKKNHTGWFNGIVTGQCGEEPMIPYSSCNLISIDLAKLVDDKEFDWVEFKYLIDIAIRFADSTIDVNKFPLPKIEEVTKGLRSIGLGVFGFAHCLIKMGIVYGSEESYKFTSQLFTFMEQESIKISERLGDDFGYFPWHSVSTIKTPRRNCYIRSIAPTGTIATLANSSFSIESIFTVAYEREVINNEFQIFDPIFEEMIMHEGLDKDKIFNLVRGKSSIQDIIEIPEHIRKLFITAHDLNPEQHVKMVSIIQEHIDTGVSKTVNVPENITIEEVDTIYRLAWESGCKGITIYRTNSREAPIKLETRPVINKDYLAPDITTGLTQRVSTGCGHYHCSVSGIDNEPLKVFVNPTTGGCQANLEALGRLTSLCLRSGIDKSLVIKQLSKVKCDSCLKSEKATCKSCADGIAQTIKLYKPTKVIDTHTTNKSQLIKCSSCDKMFEPNTKCSVCPHCGNSRCS